jgi:hypothetical protein
MEKPLFRAGVFVCLASAFLGLSIRLVGSATVQDRPRGSEAGVPIVRMPKRPAPPSGGQPALSLRADLVIGREAGDENYMFSQLRSVQVDDQDNIYALDMKEMKVRVFDPAGRHLRTFGKKGKGPGEIDTPLRMEMTPGGRLVIEDFGSGKFVVYSLDGQVLKEIPLGKYQFLIRFKFNTRNEIFADTRVYDETKMVSTLIRFNQDFEPQATLATFEEERPLRVLKPFSPTFSLNLTRQGDLVLTTAEIEKYEFTVMRPDGTPIRRLVKDYDPVKVAGAAKERLEADYDPKTIPPGYRVELPKYFPALYYSIIDDQDRLFVRTYESDERSDGPWDSYDVFDINGRYLTRFALPDREMAFVVRRNKLYCMIQENEEGFPQVKRYDMTWKVD